MSVAIGAALAKRLNQDHHIVYSLHGDGELDEGQCWEAIMYAGAKGIDNLIATVDWNGQQIDGTTDQVMKHMNLPAQFTSFGWDILQIYGNEMEEVVNGLKKAKTMTGKGKPVGILMKTHMGYPVDFMIDNHEWHGVAPNDEQLAKALEQLPVTLGDY
jgi:transketolase